ncbi:Ras-related protein Rab [Aphelenchoides besseyi]|nr:Ras-related protein Rab [Aphelenchoides besseyi]
MSLSTSTSEPQIFSEADEQFQAKDKEKITRALKTAMRVYLSKRDANSTLSMTVDFANAIQSSNPLISSKRENRIETREIERSKQFVSTSFESQQQRNEFLFKIIVVGNVAVGKTSLIQKYVRNSVDQQYKPTIGVDFSTKLIQTNDGTLLSLEIWGSGLEFILRVEGNFELLRSEYGRLLRLQRELIGSTRWHHPSMHVEDRHDRFTNMMRVYYRDAHGAVVLCDCTKKRHLFTDTVAGAFRWKKDIDNKLSLVNGQPIPAILLANKCDLKNEFSTSELHEIAIQTGFNAAFKISAKAGINIEEAFDFLVRQIIAAEKEGLYLAPISHRDHRIHRLVDSDDSIDARKRHGIKGAFHNVCC